MEQMLKNLSALNNRLIHINHTLDVQEWLGDYAEENCHPMITSYIKTHLSKCIRSQMIVRDMQHHVLGLCYQSLSSVTTVKTHHLVSSCLREVVSGYIGNSGMKFVQYCDDMLNININDVLNNYDGVKKDLEKYNRDKKTLSCFKV
jgi:hypothetical protein